MEEIDTAALRAYACPDEDGDVYYTVTALCDALDAARAEMVSREHEWVRQWAEMQERATKAEAQVAAVRAVLGDGDCPSGFAAGEPGCGCLMCVVRAALDGAVPPPATPCPVHGPPCAFDPHTPLDGGL